MFSLEQYTHFLLQAEVGLFKEAFNSVHIKYSVKYKIQHRTQQSTQTSIDLQVDYQCDR